jgi:hypothetical protein
MHKFFTSSFDASIYLQQPEQNAGRDEILEVGKLYYGSSKDIARTLIKFPITQVSKVVLEESASLNTLLNSNSASVSTISSSWSSSVSASLPLSSSYSTNLSASLYWSASYSTSLLVNNNLSSSYSQSWNNYVTQSLIKSASLYTYVSQSLLLSASYNLESSSLALDILNGEYVFNYKTYLNLKSANSEEIPLEYTLYANAVSQSWTMGTGTKFDNITSDGISWYYKDGINKWTTIISTLQNSDYSTGSQGQVVGTTGSIIQGGGAFWYTASMASQSFSNEPDDIRMDVTDLIRIWVSGSLPNNGFIIHHGLTNELDELDYGVVKFFSKETNTIYEPKLELVWDDSSFTTGNLLPITGSSSEDALENSKIIVTDLQKEYAENIKTKIRVKARDLFPSKSFTSSFEYDQSKYLPTSSYYQIEDYRTNEIIIPFGEYSKLSCDSKSNYFYLDTSTYPIDRVYILKLKVVKDGITKIIDDKLTFEIV